MAQSLYSFPVCYCSKLSQVWRLKATRIYSLTVLQGTNPTWGLRGYSQVSAEQPPTAPSKTPLGLLQAFSWLLAASLQSGFLQPQHLSFSVVRCPLSPSQKDTMITLPTSLHSQDPYLAASAKSIWPPGHIPRFQGLGLGHLEAGLSS